MEPAQTFLLTHGGYMTFETYSRDTDWAATELEEIRRGIQHAAILVHSIDQGPRKTILFHGAAQ